MAIKVKSISSRGFENVQFAEDDASGLKSIIAIHSTRLGPACGGIRLLPYPSIDEALTDVLRLAEGMSFKSAVAGLGFGGGKSVIICEPARKTKELFRSFGEFVNHLDGRYIAAKDMNISNPDLLAVRETSKHVLGLEGVEGSGGDPSPITAIGCFEAMAAAWESLTGDRSLKGLRVCIQGLGHVGFDLARRLKKSGAKLFVADIDQAAVERAKLELGAIPCLGDSILEAECEIFCPAARGAALNRDTIPRLRCRAVVGPANNQLATPEDGYTLWKKGILYAPDYVVNAGGIINIFIEYEGYDRTRAVHRAEGVFATVKLILERAQKENVPPFIVADRIANERLRG